MVKGDAGAVRKGLSESLPAVDQAGSTPERSPAFTYVPPSHARALDPDTSVVEGIRGAGKSFWWAHLVSVSHREFINSAFPEARFDTNVRVVQGFGAQPSSEHAPSKEVIESVIRRFPPKAIWRAVCAHKGDFPAPFPRGAKWSERIAWVAKNPEEFDELLQGTDGALEKSNRTLIVLFDALDRLADDWPHIRPLAKGLLQTAQDLRATKRIRFKVFVRPDMLQDAAITGFPDASKLLGRKAALTWRRADLYALLFQCLGNARRGGEAFRGMCEQDLSLKWTQTGGGWVLPSPLRTDERLQEQAFIYLAGGAMGSGPSGFKRGKPYSWLVNHLQDGLDQVSPRSFFAAVRAAAEETPDEYPLALAFRAIHTGVQAASQIRVTEITGEDYPWVDLVMQPLRGRLTVPCQAADIAVIWNKEGTLASLQEQLGRGAPAVKLPPPNLEGGVVGVLHDLEELGLLKLLWDGRIQMPDVYRIAFGVGRRGGVKPLR